MEEATAGAACIHDICVSAVRIREALEGRLAGLYPRSRGVACERGRGLLLLVSVRRAFLPVVEVEGVELVGRALALLVHSPG